MRDVKIELTFTEELLGTLAGNKELAKEFILANNPNVKATDEDEALKNLPDDEKLQKSSTVFNRFDESGRPFLWDYQIRGFFKDAMGFLKRGKINGFEKLSYKKVVDGLVFIEPRKIPLLLPKGVEADSLGICERSLRAQTQHGERIALARSEVCPVGTRMEFTIVLLDEKLMPLIEDCLNYGKYRGIGQWRNSGKGRFVWKMQ
jgi:hypothetical protein